MIDSVSTSSPVMPPISGVSTVAQAATGSADPADSKAIPQPALACAPHASFANTLQNRLKLIALNKTAATTAVAAPDENQDKLLQLSVQLAQQANQPALPLNVGIIPEVRSTAAPDEKPDKTAVMTDDTASAAIALATSEAVPAVPLALNISIPLARTSPSTAANGTGDTMRETATASTGSGNARAPAEPAAAAILAAAPEKAALIAANQGREASDSAFSSLLHNATAHTGLISAQAPPPAVVSPLPIREVASPVTSAYWASDVGNQLSWMINQRESRADLVLNPPQLGRIEVSITLNGDQASASFVSMNPDVRDALQGSLPRLREVLADAGIFLGQANIGAESFRQGENGAEKGGKSPDDSFSLTGQSLLGFDNGPLSIVPTRTTSRGMGVIDLFA